MGCKACCASKKAVGFVKRFDGLLSSGVDQHVFCNFCIESSCDSI